MQQSYIRLARTPEVQKVLSYLQQKFSLLSEPEIIKLALSEKYEQEQNIPTDKATQAKKAWEELKREGPKIGEKFMRKKGLDPKKVTEQQFHEIFLDDHHH